MPDNTRTTITVTRDTQMEAKQTAMDLSRTTGKTVTIGETVAMALRMLNKVVTRNPWEVLEPKP